MSTLKNVVDNLLHEGRIKRAYLGIISNTIELPREITTQEATGQDSGVIVLAVETESPAKRAGLKLGDVIVKFDENPVASTYDLPKLLTRDAIGKETKLQILRAEELMELTVTPIEARGIMNR
jgi:S1-C subfamily serine protease